MNRPRKYAKREHIDCLDLIREIEIRPVIWDARHVAHHNRISLQTVWNQIGNVLNSSGMLLFFVVVVVLCGYAKCFCFCR